MAGMGENPYQSPREPGEPMPARNNAVFGGLLVWDACNVLLWFIVLATLAALLLPAGQ